MANSDASPQPPPDPPPAPAATPATPAAPATQIDAPPIFKGSVSHWMAFTSYATAIVLELIGLVALIFGTKYLHHNAEVAKMSLDLGYVGLIGGLALILASTIMIFYTSLAVRSHCYTITHRLIERESGILVKKVDALDLGRVKHVDMKQSFIERVLNVGTIDVYSSDLNEPELRIEDIPDPRPVYEKLRDAVIDLSRRRGVIIE